MHTTHHSFEANTCKRVQLCTCTALLDRLHRFQPKEPSIVHANEMKIRQQYTDDCFTSAEMIWPMMYQKYAQNHRQITKWIIVQRPQTESPVIPIVRTAGKSIAEHKCSEIENEIGTTKITKMYGDKKHTPNQNNNNSRNDKCNTCISSSKYVVLFTAFPACTHMEWADQVWDPLYAQQFRRKNTHNNNNNNNDTCTRIHSK